MTDKILALLSVDVVEFEISEDRKTCTVREQCDRHFKEYLTKKHMYKLANEIKELADFMVE